MDRGAWEAAVHGVAESDIWAHIHTLDRAILHIVICTWCWHMASHRIFFYLYYMVSFWVCLGLFSSVQSFSRVRLFATPWTAAHQASLSINNSQNLPKLMSIELVMPSNHLILCCPHLLLPSIFPNIRVFSNESALRIRRPKHWFQLQHQSLQWTPRTNFL